MRNSTFVLEFFQTDDYGDAKEFYFFGVKARASREVDLESIKMNLLDIKKI